jgi:amino acid transporter
MLIYLVTNVAYFYALPAAAVASTDRVASEAAAQFLGEGGRDAVAIAAMISIFAALNGSLLSGARVPYAMARDKYFFTALGRVHDRYLTPHVALMAQSSWAALLVLSGRYEQLFTLVIFAAWIFYGMTAASVFVLRRKRPDMKRPYRTLGYPLVPALFVFMAGSLVIMTLFKSPRESLTGLLLIAIGVPFYKYWKKRA